MNIPDEVITDKDKGAAYWDAVKKGMESVGSENKMLRYRVMDAISRQYDPEELILMRQEGYLDEALGDIAQKEYEQMQLEDLTNDEFTSIYNGGEIPPSEWI
mgnify:FL=1